MPRSRICVYCGSSSGNGTTFLASAEKLGHALAEHQYDLVYGGASIGLMGAIADAVLKTGGAVYGVMPQSLADKEIAHPGLTELIVTSSMHERKTRMADLSDGFIAMPGGLGTLEELFEIWTWAQLGFHEKPIGLLNVDGYFDLLIEFISKASVSGFVKPAHQRMLLVEQEPGDLFVSMKKYVAVAEPKIVKIPDQR